MQVRSWKERRERGVTKRALPPSKERHGHVPLCKAQDKRPPPRNCRHPSFMIPVILSLLAAFLPVSHASVTTYGPLLFTPTTVPGAGPTNVPYSGFQAFDPTTVAAPAPSTSPNPNLLQLSTANVPGLSIPHSAGDFVGLSIELSIADTIRM